MLFNSLHFALFLPVVLLVYWLLRRSLRWQNLFVLAASYFFYGCWDWRFLGLIVLVSGSSYGLALLMGGAPAARRRLLLAVGLALNLGVLALFKYQDFFVSSLASLIPGADADSLLIHAVLPVGVSFYTFQAVGYLIDVYRRQAEPSRDAVAYFAYISFFPQLVAGPIERAQNLLPQFGRPRRFCRAQAADGLRQMLWGYFKKVVVADTAAAIADPLFADPSAYSGAALAAGALLFSVQIYCDFSGYSDIAIGCARLFGFSLRQNFATPYFSRDIAEFWRRWHISLTTWFRDYLYIPLGGSRTSRPKVVRNTFIIFLVSGLWHGANWTFLLWGLYHACLFLPLILLGRNRRHTGTVAEGRLLPTLPDALRMLLTFLLAAVGWVIFRAPSAAAAWAYLRGIFTQGFHGLATLGSGADLFTLGLTLPILIIIEWLNRAEPHGFSRQPRHRALRWAGYAALCFVIVAFMKTADMPFIYFQF